MNIQGDLHVVCYHGLGDALRYALPLAASFGAAGKCAYLHTRFDLARCIGEQPLITGIAGADDDFIFRRFPNVDAAAEAYLENCPVSGGAIILGASAFDVALERLLRERGVPCWGRLSGGVELLSSESAAKWRETPEYYHGEAELCAIFGVPLVSIEKRRPNPSPEFREHPFGDSGKPLVGLHCSSVWPSRSYPHRAKLFELLARDFEVWNFDEKPCDSIARLAWIMRESKAVLTIDSMILHLANALGVLTLNIQGPVWHNTSEAPYVIPGTRLGDAPVPLASIDRNSQPLGAFSPEFIAAEFKAFCQSSDKARWQA